MEYTENLHLPRWSEDDYILVDDFNAMTASLDALCGNCCIKAGSYVGNGTYGANNPVTIELGFKPLVFFPNCTNQSSNGEHQVWIIPGNDFDSLSNTSTHYYVTWGDTFFSWYARNRNNSEDIAYQFNEEGKTYYYVAIGVIAAGSESPAAFAAVAQEAASLDHAAAAIAMAASAAAKSEMLSDEGETSSSAELAAE